MLQSVHIRHALLCESHVLASIGAAAFLDDPFDAYLYPNRKVNIKAYRKLYQRGIVAAMHEPLAWVLVAEIPEPTHVSPNTHLESSTAKSLVGYSIWTRESSKKQEKETRKRLRLEGLQDTVGADSLTARIRHRILNSSIIEEFSDWMNPIVDRRKAEKFWSNLVGRNEDGRGPEEPEAEEYWYLRELAVAPEHRRRGVGRALLNWGITWAQKENLLVLLESTPMGRELYQREGFVNYGIWRWGDEPDMTWASMQWKPCTKHA